MNRQDELYERYEDALFAILMDKVAKEEGDRLLEENERLNADPAAAVPESLDRMCRKTIRREFRKKRIIRLFVRPLRPLAMLYWSVFDGK